VVLITAREAFGLRPNELIDWVLATSSARQTLAARDMTAHMVVRTVDGRLAPAVAYVNHGRLVADCPTDGCGGALLVHRTAGLFLCPYCLVGPRRIVTPRDLDAIEAMLGMRPVLTTRNWRPGETLADLRLENAAHGIEGRP